MFGRLLEKINTFAAHHQVLVALVVALGIIFVTWGTEKILEDYIFPHKPLYGYITIILLGLFILWLTKHVILHVV